MKEVKVLSSKDYFAPHTKNYGDCILINTGTELFIYDCGSVEHAKEAINYMNAHNYTQATLILSHNDDDHYLGIPYLIEENRISKIYTVLLLKHCDDILDCIDDKRKSKDSIKKDILEKYDNIKNLSGHNLNDIYDEDKNCNIALSDEISIVGPSYDYMLQTVSKRLDGREGDTVDGETAVNATSIQLEILFDNNKILLCGDCSFQAIEETILNYNVIQLPHHGKPKQAELIFEKKLKQPDTNYLISDNTGNSNAGSDDLDITGHKVSTTKDGTITIDSNFFASRNSRPWRSLGI